MSLTETSNGSSSFSYSLQRINMNQIIQTQVGPMTVQEALNILRYTNMKLLGFDESMLSTYLSKD